MFPYCDEIMLILEDKKRTKIFFICSDKEKNYIEAYLVQKPDFKSFNFASKLLCICTIGFVMAKKN